MPSIRQVSWLSACFFALAGCAGGASVATDEDPGHYPVQVSYETLGFNGSVPPQSIAGVTATLVPGAVQPVLYYRYDVQSQVNGNYIAMPNPPMLYTIRRVPFYKADSSTMMVHLELQNTTDEVVSAGQAVCSFDIAGKTVTSTPLGSQDLLPGHSLSFDIHGPSLDQFESKPEGTMTVWVYGLGADKNHPLRWDMAYVLKQESRTVWGAMLQTASGDVAKSYKDRVDVGQPGDEVGAAPSNDTSERR